MNIRFSLNGVSASLDAEPGDRLSILLRDHFHLKGTKCGCLQGRCGVCAVFWNGALCASCLIPAFKLQGSHVLTIEGFMKTPAYLDIEQGFKEANVETCGYCYAAKVLSAENILQKEKKPEKDDVLQELAGIRCVCTDLSSLLRGVEAAWLKRRERGAYIVEQLKN